MGLISWTGGTTDSVGEHLKESVMNGSLIVPLAVGPVVPAGCVNPLRGTGCSCSDVETKFYALDSLECSNLSSKCLNQYRSVLGTPHR